MNGTCTIPLDYHKEDKQGYHEMYRLVMNEQEMITELFPRLLTPTWKTTTATQSEQKADNSEQGWLLSAHAGKTFLLLPFCECIARSAVFGAVEFDNWTFEGESLFNRSSVSHLMPVTVKSNSKWREKCPFHIDYSNFRVDNPLFVHTCHRQRWRFPCNKDEAKQALIHFCSTPKSTTDLIRR